MGSAPYLVQESHFTRLTFAQGEVRFVISNGKKRIYMEIASAAEELLPILNEVGDQFKTTDIKVLAIDLHWMCCLPQS